MRVENIILNEERNVSLTAYVQETGGEFRSILNRPAMIVIPGGGYQFCSDREADPVALAYLEAGFHAFVLRYSVQEHAVWPNPLQDYEQAYELICEKADEWHVLTDKIGVVGFSAGGHLAAAAATLAKNRPAAAVLGYAVVNDDVKGCNPTAPNLVQEVSYNTCPCFLFATRTDNVVPIENTLQFASALTEAGVAFETHIYSYGPHGFSVGNTSVQEKETAMSGRIMNWTADSIAWLFEVLGEFGENGLDAPKCKAHMTDDGEAFLSVDCTVKRLMENPLSREMLKPLVEQSMQMILAVQNAGKEDEGSSQNAEEIGMKIKLRDLLGFVQQPENVIAELDEKLHQIPNI